MVFLPLKKNRDKNMYRSFHKFQVMTGKKKIQKLKKLFTCYLNGK